MRLSAVVATIALASVSTLVAVPPAFGESTALSRPCADVEVIVARGSGQTLGGSSEMNTFTGDLAAHLNDAVSIDHPGRPGSQALGDTVRVLGREGPSPR